MIHKPWIVSLDNPLAGEDWEFVQALARLSKAVARREGRPRDLTATEILATAHLLGWQRVAPAAPVFAWANADDLK